MLSENKLIYLGEACRMVFNSKEDNPYTNTMAETVWKLAHDSCLSCIEACAVVDAVEVVHGRWSSKILTGGFAEEWGYVCSECGCVVSDKSGLGKYRGRNQQLNYCPNCGAKMDLEE
jgi:hypothetical protein